MVRRFAGMVAGLALGVIASGCSTLFPRDGPGWLDVKFTDPVCGRITLEILDGFHVPHKRNTIPSSVWERWSCKRHIGAFGRITLVALREPKPYRLMLEFGSDGHVIAAKTDPATWQPVIGAMTRYARLDELSRRGRDYFANNTAVKFNFQVKPG